MPFKSKNSKYWQYDFQIRGRRFFGSCGTEDYQEAKDIEAQARVAAKTKSVFTGKFTLGEALGTYWTDICEPQSSAKTAKSQGCEIAKIIDPSMYIDKITEADVLRFIRVRRAQVSNGTVNRHLDMLSRSIAHMKRYKGAQPDINIRSMRLPEPKERVRELTADEQIRLFQNLRPDFHNYCKFALMTGARLETIVSLKWSDVDLDARNIVFRLKGDDQMVFPINGELMALLGALPRSNLLAYRKYVFTYINQKTLERQRIGQGGGFHASFRRGVTEADIEDFRFHDFRHTFATRMLRKTGNLKLVSRLLGHKSLETTMRYAHCLDEDLRNALNDFNVFELTRSEGVFLNVKS